MTAWNHWPHSAPRMITPLPHESEGDLLDVQSQWVTEDLEMHSTGTTLVWHPCPIIIFLDDRVLVLNKYWPDKSRRRYPLVRIKTPT